jgi:hypothetical protein
MLILYNFELKNLKTLLDCEDVTIAMTHYHLAMHSIDGNRNGCFSTDDVPVQLQLDELAGRSGPVGEHAYK